MDLNRFNIRKQRNYPICPRSITTKSFSSRATTAYGSWKSGVKQTYRKKTTLQLAAKHSETQKLNPRRAHRLDTESHTASGNPQWGSPSPGQRCSSHAWRSDRLSSPPCRKTDLQTEPWTGLCGPRKHRHLNFAYSILSGCYEMLNGWGGMWKSLLLPPEILCPHFESTGDGRCILFNYNEHYIKFCPLIPDKK